MRVSIGFVIALIFFVGCLDPFNFETSPEDFALVVDGQLNTSHGPHVLKISKSLPFGFKNFDPVSGASVVLIGDDFIEPFIESNQGVYVLPEGRAKGISGYTYYVEIKVAGKTYRSNPEIMPDVQKADRAFYGFERDVIFQNGGVEIIGDVLNVFVDSGIFRPTDSETYIKWIIDELFLFTDQVCGPFDNASTCYVPLKTRDQHVQIFSTELLDVERLEGIKVYAKTSFPRVQFHGRHYFNVYQQAITRDAYNYWERVNELTSQRGTVFDLPPANLKGNLYNVDDENERVLGYFELSAVDTVRTFIYAFQFKEVVDPNDYCSPFRRRDWPIECCSCTAIENASLERPEWLD